MKEMTISWTVLTLIFISVTISAIAQVTLKQGMSSPTVQQGLAGGWLEIVIAVASNLYVWLGLIFYALGAVLWLGVLARDRCEHRISFCRFGLYSYSAIWCVITRRSIFRHTFCRHLPGGIRHCIGYPGLLIITRIGNPRHFAVHFGRRMRGSRQAKVME